jgi:hypothetical protein
LGSCEERPAAATVKGVAGAQRGRREKAPEGLMSAHSTGRVAACLITLALVAAAAPPAPSIAQTHVAPTQTHV